MTFKDAWNAIVGPRLRKPSGPITDPAERESRRLGESEEQRLKRISTLSR